MNFDLLFTKYVINRKKAKKHSGYERATYIVTIITILLFLCFSYDVAHLGVNDIFLQTSENNLQDAEIFARIMHIYIPAILLVGLIVLYLAKGKKTLGWSNKGEADNVAFREEIIYQTLHDIYIEKNGQYVKEKKKAYLESIHNSYEGNKKEINQLFSKDNFEKLENVAKERLQKKKATINLYKIVGPAIVTLIVVPACSKIVESLMEQILTSSSAEFLMSVLNFSLVIIALIISILLISGIIGIISIIADIVTTKHYYEEFINDLRQISFLEIK